MREEWEFSWGRSSSVLRVSLWPHNMKPVSFSTPSCLTQDRVELGWKSTSFWQKNHRYNPLTSKNIAVDPSQVEAYMTPLLASAKETIPQDKQASTPIYLLATAGMRQLREDRANAISAEVRKPFNDNVKCHFFLRTIMMLELFQAQSKGSILGLR